MKNSVYQLIEDLIFTDCVFYVFLFFLYTIACLPLLIVRYNADYCDVVIMCDVISLTVHVYQLLKHMVIVKYHKTCYQ